MTDLDEIPTFEARNEIRKRLRLILETIDAPVTAKLIHEKSEVPWSVENIAMALRLMARDGQCKEVHTGRNGDWYAHNKWRAVVEQKPAAEKPPKTSKPRVAKAVPPQKEQPKEEEVRPMADAGSKETKGNSSVDRALSDLEFKILGRKVDDFETKDRVLERLGTFMDPSIAAVLESIRSDLRTMNGAA